MGISLVDLIVLENKQEVSEFHSLKSKKENWEFYKFGGLLLDEEF